MSILDPKFVISEDILNKCKQFGLDSVSSSADKYARREQFNIDKIAKDICVGRVGEEAVYEKVSALYPNISKPDYQIYDKKSKSWSPDLIDIDSGIHLAVKSQNIDSSIAHSDSWVFQYNYNKNYDCDTGVFKEKDPNHYVAFVSLNIPKRCGEIKAIVKIQWLHDKQLFKDMKKENLRGNKLAVYFNDLLEFPDELWQLT